MRYIHAEISNDGDVVVYADDQMIMKDFKFKSQAIIYLQKEGFKISAHDGLSVWLAKKIYEI